MAKNSYRKHLYGKKKRDEKRTLIEVYKKHPIIKSDQDSRMDDGTRYITFQVPIRHNVYAIRSRINQSLNLTYNNSDSIEEARRYIDNLPEIKRRVDLIKKINNLKQKIKAEYEKTIKGYRSFNHLRYTFDKLPKHPRENIMGIELNSKGKKIGERIVQHGRSFLLTPEEQEAVIRTLFNIEDTSPEDIKSTIKNILGFNQDVSDNMDIANNIVSTYDKEEITAYFKNTSKIVKVLKSILNMAIEKQGYYDAHGCDTRDNVTIPKGFKLMPENYYCWEGYNAEFTVQSEDETIEILVFLGKGLGGYSGEVQYKIEKDGNYYSIGRRGIDSAFYYNKNSLITIGEIILEQAAEARKRQERIKRSVNVTLGGRTWKVTPESIEKIKEELNKGKSHSFLPSGMGIGIIIANSQKNLPYNLPSYHAGESAEKTFGMSIYAQDFEYD